MGSRSSKAKKAEKAPEAAAAVEEAAVVSSAPAEEKEVKSLPASGEGKADDGTASAVARKSFEGLPGIEHGYTTHIGFGGLKRENQDRGILVEEFGGNPDMFFAGVFDGHGGNGCQAAQAVQDQLPGNVLAELGAAHDRDPVEALTAAFVKTDAELGDSSGADMMYSGATATAALLQGKRLIVACVGDSRAVLGRMQDSGEYAAIEMSRDHRPDLEDERARVVAAGGRVEPKVTSGGTKFGPGRIWLKDQQTPGLMVSRSLGDKLAHSVGCSPEPEIKELTLTAGDRFLILASDGLWEVVSSVEAVEIVSKSADDPEEALKQLLSICLSEWEDRYMADNIYIAILIFYHF